jgi:hypothetical protein
MKGEMEVTGRRGRRRKKLLDDLKERRGYCHLKEEALDRTVWRNRFGRGFGPVVSQIEYSMNVPAIFYVFKRFGNEANSASKGTLRCSSTQM